MWDETLNRLQVVDTSDIIEYTNSRSIQDTINCYKNDLMDASPHSKNRWLRDYVKNPSIKKQMLNFLSQIFDEAENKPDEFVKLCAEHEGELKGRGCFCNGLRMNPWFQRCEQGIIIMIETSPKCEMSNYPQNSISNFLFNVFNPLILDHTTQFHR
ncbi:MAG: hypothetical protein HQK51_15675 [Oligoflexia bacterium]|nr:hypothetical protein [Oligoflexia bacterium]